jgi:hypothetical protein
MQQGIQAAQQKVASEVVVGSAGGGAVTVEVTGGMEFRSVTIDPAVVDPSDVDMLQDLVLAAVRDASEKASELHATALGSLDLGRAFGGLSGLLGQ